MRYNLLGQAEHWFPGENVLSLQTEGLAALLKESPFVDRIEAILNDAHAMMFEAPKKRLSQS